MACRETQSLLDSYVDGELDLVRSLEIEQHLRDCKACSQLYKNHQALRNALSANTLYFKVPAHLRTRIRSSVHQASKADSSPRLLPWHWLSLAAALALVVLIAGGLFWSLSMLAADDVLAQEVTSSHVRSLMVNHLADVSSSDQHTVKPWFDGKLDFSPPVEDLAQQGFPLVGGRLDYLDNRPVAALVYQRRQHLINLLVWPSTRGSASASKTVTRQGYHLIQWTQLGMTYWAVSDLNTDELQEFVQLIQNQVSLTTPR